MKPIEDLRLNQTQAAAVVGISRRELTREDDPAPCEDDGTYILKRLITWAIARAGNETDAQIKFEKLRKLARENEVAERRLIDIEELRPHTSALQDALRDFGDKIARKKTITGSQAQAMFNKTLRTVEAKLERVSSADG